ncbi:MAG: tRNA pseudouridine(55) synthase TruB [Candidatus Krumholzibacteriia bacterium]|nr:tRNA pseudouridine(55) synthase TruB [bacterium]MCB9513257.1 tRNA pseudouridine(55) synthase TruB [Candidatus Latescibacterota bacterium]MCB9514720.1 tRNA pseudouridine(55) synthase TruB [Candidatus Latescibacterota bacterium]
MSRLVLVDKPEGPTSHDVVSTLRRTLGIKKAGHCGTLDPMASGLLLILTGWATRLAEVFGDHVKVYQGTVRFGSATDTDDRQGKVVASAADFALAPAALDDALATLAARREQRPPVYSAIKREGVPLYKLARAGKLEADDAPPPRPVTIHRLERLDWDGRDLVVEVECSAGTYVRALARDLGELVGVPAHLRALRRLRSGPFSVEHAVGADRLLWEDSTDPLGLPLEVALADLPAAVTRGDYAERLRFGAQPGVEDLDWDFATAAEGAWVRVLSPEDALLALARVERPASADAPPRLRLRRRLVD